MVNTTITMLAINMAAKTNTGAKLVYPSAANLKKFNPVMMPLPIATVMAAVVM